MHPHLGYGIGKCRCEDVGIDRRQCVQCIQGVQSCLRPIACRQQRLEGFDGRSFPPFGDQSLGRIPPPAVVAFEFRDEFGRGQFGKHGLLLGRKSAGASR